MCLALAEVKLPLRDSGDRICLHNKLSEMYPRRFTVNYFGRSRK